MRIARVITKLELGGAQLAALSLTRELRRHGVETRVLAGHATPEGLSLFREQGIDVEVWGDDPDIQYSCREELAEWVAARLAGVDLVHAHMFGGWWAAAQAAPPGLPLVASEHNALRWQGRPRRDAMLTALERVELFFAHGPAVRSLLRELDYPEERTRVGRSPVGGLDARPRPDLPSPRVVFAGRLHHEKGPDVLIDALAQLERRPATFILGSGPMEAELRRRVADLGLADVTFVGWVDDPGSWIAGASACVVPSRHEAWSQTAALAMGLGTPVIAAAVEGLPTTLGAGRGLLFRPDDTSALARALESVLSGRRSTDLAAARTYARGFAKDGVAADYYREYRMLVQRRGWKRIFTHAVQTPGSSPSVFPSEFAALSAA